MDQPTNNGDLNTQSQQQHQQQQQQQQQQQWMPQQHAPQQQWMAMQYPAAAMAMMQQQMMMYPQQYMAYAHPGHYPQQHHQQQQLQQPPYYHQPTQLSQNHKQDEIRTIWVGDLHHWMEEAYLQSCFAHTGQVCSTKVIRNKQTGQSEGYGFVEFFSRPAAEKVLLNYNGTLMPNTDQPFRLNWAAFSAGERRTDGSFDLSIFVGDLATDVTDAMLLETFASRYPSVKGAKVVIDSNTGRSKGYGFVRFGDENERSKAINEMNGECCSSRPMRIGVATPKKSSGYQQQYNSQAVILAGGHGSNGVVAQGSQSYGDSNNTTIFVGGLDSDVTDEDLRQTFYQFGEIISVKIPVGKACGFVQFADRKNAEDAIESLNGTVIGKQTVRLSWGRTSGNKQQWRVGSNNQWNGAQHYGGNGYGGYGNGYAAHEQEDIGMTPAAAVNGAS